MISRLPPITSRWHRARPSPTKPDQIWVTDITYVETAEGWLYLAGVLDLYSRRLIGWAMGSSLETALPLAALHMALRQRRPLPGVLHHSDRGCQYASAVYRQTLADHGCVASMSRKGNCYDNAAMESFWATLKTEAFGTTIPANRAAAITMIFDYITTFYNSKRLHSSLGYMSPLDFEASLN
jgi:transposase InsO family protein